MSSFPKLDLVYFPIRARAEPARMIMAYGGIPYTDKDCDGFFGMSFGEAKQGGKLPFGQLPVLHIGREGGRLIESGRVIEGGRLIAQSGSINRYLAALVKSPGFFPTDLSERAYCDMIHDSAEEIFKIMPIVNIYRGEKFQQEKEDYFKNVLPSRLQALAKLLATKQFFCGNTVTYCDFSIYHIFDLCRLVEPKVFKEFPYVQQWMSRVEKLPGVSGYLANRPEPFGIDGKVNPHLKIMT